MTQDSHKTSPPPFTHDAFLFVRTGMRKGRIFGYWKHGGKFREGDEPFAFIDMLPRGGWDGRIRFVPIGDPPPENESSLPIRPGTEIESEDGTGSDAEAS